LLNRREWAMYCELIPMAGYRRIADRFAPEKWADTAVRMGAR
jgi:hypothetical protein